jgi:hypothetical protein
MANVSLEDLPVSSLVRLIGSTAIAPGAGAAGAVALALAAACGAKAVAVSAKHAPADAELSAAMEKFTEIGLFALRDAQWDSTAFEEFLHHRNPQTIANLVGVGESLARLIDETSALLAHIEPHVRSSVRGDLVAARALAAAARAIQSTNENQARSEQGELAANGQDSDG